MSRKRLTTALVVAVPVISALIFLPRPTPLIGAHPARTPYLRILPLGDSITAGAGGTTGGGYRAPLWELARQRHLFAIDFVGSLASRGVVDPQHEGHSGWRTDQIRANIDNWLATSQPDVILLHIGINDLHQDHTVDQTLASFQSLLDRIFVDQPDVTVIYGGLIAVTDGLQNRAAHFNAGAQQIIAAKARQGHRVRYVDLPITAAQMKDKLHPNDAGYATMARTFETALEQSAREMVGRD
jgi:lysophospholipase L1-like esterase